MAENKGGRPRKKTQVMSCRVDPEFKRTFEAAAQSAGKSNGDYLQDFYDEHQEVLGQLRNYEACVRDSLP